MPDWIAAVGAIKFGWEHGCANKTHDGGFHRTTRTIILTDQTEKEICEIFFKKQKNFHLLNSKLTFLISTSGVIFRGRRRHVDQHNAACVSTILKKVLNRTESGCFTQLDK